MQHTEKLTDLIIHAATAIDRATSPFNELKGYALAFEVIAATATKAEDRHIAETWRKHMQDELDWLNQIERDRLFEYA